MLTGSARGRFCNTAMLRSFYRLRSSGPCRQGQWLPHSCRRSVHVPRQLISCRWLLPRFSRFCRRDTGGSAPFFGIVDVSLHGLFEAGTEGFTSALDGGFFELVDDGGIGCGQRQVVRLHFGCFRKRSASANKAAA